MLAAESDLPQLFDLMIRHDGDCNGFGITKFVQLSPAELIVPMRVRVVLLIRPA